MRYENVFIAGVASYLPSTLSTAEAIEDQVCPPELAEQSGVEAVTVAIEAPVQMAARAAQAAIAQAGTPPISLVLHAGSSYQGHDRWSAAAYVQRVALGSRNPATTLDVSQLSNGAMAALDLAAGYLAGGSATASLLTAADRFCLPNYDRWRSLPGTPLGDGASALVLRRDAGFARLRSIVSWSDPELEGLHRGDDPFGTAPFSHRRQLDEASWQSDFVARLGAGNVQRLLFEGSRSAFLDALRDAGVDVGEIDWFVPPNLGRRHLEDDYYKPFGIDPERTTWRWGRRTGHLGVADQFAMLDQLMHAGQLRPGTLCALLGASGGPSWTCAVIEIISQPVLPR